MNVLESLVEQVYKRCAVYRYATSLLFEGSGIFFVPHTVPQISSFIVSFMLGNAAIIA